MNKNNSFLCEVCFVASENLDHLLNHYFDANHPQIELEEKVTNKEIRKILDLKPIQTKSNEIPIITNVLSKEPSNFSNDNNNNKNLNLNKIIVNDDINQNKIINNNNLNNPNLIKRKCDICFEEIEPNYRQYALHAIKSHNPFAVKEFVEDKFIVDFINSGGTSGVKSCDICFTPISLDVNDYIVHVQRTHGNLINRSLSKYIKDRYVVSVLLGKSLYSNSSCTTNCMVCGETLELEELMEHMQEHKKIKNAFNNYYPNENHLKNNPALKQKIAQFNQENQEDDYNGFYGLKKPNSNIGFNNGIQSNNNPFDNNYGFVKNPYVDKPFVNTYVNNQPPIINPHLKNMQNKDIKNFETLLNVFKIMNLEKNDVKEKQNSEEIKKLKEKINSMEKRLCSIEEQNKQYIEERDKLKKEIGENMQKNEYNFEEIQKKFKKLTDLETKITETSQALKDQKKNFSEDINKFKKDFDEKFEEKEKKIANLESEFLKLIDDKNENFVMKFHEHEKLIASMKIEMLNLKDNYYFKIPAEWEDQNDSLKLINLKTNSLEYIKISKMFIETLRNIKIIRIIRVQNLDLWKNFCYGRYQLKRKGNDQERLLFHGTRNNDPKEIYSAKEEGFDMRYANPNGMFGVAIYFHERANYSNDYSYKIKNMNYMFLARVLVGNSINLIVSDNSLRLPPLKNDGSGERYDSVNSEGKFMIYNNYRAYPEYLIEY